MTGQCPGIPKNEKTLNHEWLDKVKTLAGYEECKKILESIQVPILESIQVAQPQQPKM